MIVALEKILGVQLPIYKYERLFKKEANPEEIANLNKLNTLIKEITDNRNKGVECSIEHLAKKYDLHQDEISRILELFTRTTELLQIDIDGGFKNFSPPASDAREKFREPFPENSIFDFKNSARAESYLKEKLPTLADDLDALGYDEELTITELPDFIEDLFFAYWDVETCTIPLYTLYLLSQKGGDFLPVRDYAIEFLRVFWHTILPDKSEQRIEDFIIDYGLFCYNVLYPVGLIEIDPKIDRKIAEKATFMIKATPFFYEWLRFNPSQ